MYEEEWQDHAACRGVDVELFYSTEEADVAEALGYCESCPVRELCLEAAMSGGESFGVWGGTRENERRRVFRARRRRRQPPTAA